MELLFIITRILLRKLYFICANSLRIDCEYTKIYVETYRSFKNNVIFQWYI